TQFTIQLGAEWRLPCDLALDRTVIKPVDLYPGYAGFFFFSSRRRHTRFSRDWSSDVCFPIWIVDAHHFLGAGIARMGDGEAEGRSEERRGGKECRARWAQDHEKRKGKEWE